MANSELYDFRTTTFVRAVFSNCLFSVEHVYQCTYFSTVAPCERRNTTTWSWPLQQARWSGVIPLLFCKFIMRMFLPTKRLSTIASQPNLKQNKWTVDKKSYCAKTKQVNHVFFILLSSNQVTYQPWDAVFHHQMKHREESWKYDAQRSIFDELRDVSSGHKTLCRMLVITSQTIWF